MQCLTFPDAPIARWTAPDEIRIFRKASFLDLLHPALRFRYPRNLHNPKLAQASAALTHALEIQDSSGPFRSMQAASHSTQLWWSRPTDHQIRWRNSLQVQDPAACASRQQSGSIPRASTVLWQPPYRPGEGSACAQPKFASQSFAVRVLPQPFRKVRDRYLGLCQLRAPFLLPFK